MHSEPGSEHPNREARGSGAGRAQAQQFLEYLAGTPDAVFQFRTLGHNGGVPSNKRGTFAERHDYLAKRNAAGFDIFVTVNETDGGTRGDDVVAVRAVFVDFDERLEGERLALRKQRLDYFNSIAPVSIVVETSPGKFHAYWFTFGMALERFVSFQKDLAAVLGGDPAICDLPRIMRVPGFVHWKGAPFLSRICYVSEPKRRRRADFVLPDVLEEALQKTSKKFGPWDAPRPQRKARPKPDNGPGLFDAAPSTPDTDERRYALAALANAIDNVKTAPEGTRNVILNTEAFSLARFVAAGALSRAEIEEGLADAATEAGLRAHEVRSTLKSGIDAGIREGGNGHDTGAEADPASTATPCPITLEDFVAYREQHNYIFKPTRAMWLASAVDDELPPVRTPGRKAMRASRWIATHQAVQQTWAPGEPELIEGRLASDGGFIERDGVSVFNLYRAPLPAQGDAAKAGRWTEHVRHVYPDDADHIIMFLAHRVQRPHEKINHALLLGGGQGIGKDTLLEPVKRAIGHWNFGEASPSEMFASFNKFQRSVILRVSEGRDLGDADRFKLYDRMKTVIAAPPDVLRINEKNLREYYVPNCCSVIITSNYKTDGIYLPEDDRRHYVAYSDLTKEGFTKDHWDGIWGWYEDGGYGHVAAYLAALDISSFAPKAPPPRTAAFQAIVDAGRAPEIPEMMDVLDKLDNPAAVTLEQLRDKAPEPFLLWLDDRRNRRTIPHRLESAGYVPVRNPDAPSHGLWQVRNAGRTAIYVKRSLSHAAQVTAARELAEGKK